MWNINDFLFSSIQWIHLIVFNIFKNLQMISINIDKEIKTASVMIITPTSFYLARVGDTIIIIIQRKHVIVLKGGLVCSCS
jgi:hypothetical protein